MEACVFHGNTSVGFGGCQISMETSPAKMAEQLWLFWAEFSWGKGTNSSSTFLFLRLLISAVRFQAVFLTSCKVRVQKEFQFGRSSSFWVPFLISWRHQYDTRYKDADCIPRIPQQEWWFGTRRAGKPMKPASIAYVCIPNSHDLRWGRPCRCWFRQALKMKFQPKVQHWVQWTWWKNWSSKKGTTAK